MLQMSDRANPGGGSVCALREPKVLKFSNGLAFLEFLTRSCLMMRIEK